MKWYIEFDKTSLKQRSVIDEVCSGQSNYWIRGFAGSGKTLVMTLSMERLLAKNPNSKIAFITFTHALTDLVYDGFSRGKSKMNVEVITHKAFLKKCREKEGKLIYDYVFLDEVQDVRASELRGVFKYAENVILAGDTEQKIYGFGVTERDIRRISKSGV